MLEEMKGLYAKGMACHWLHPESKRPIESKWTSGERKTIAELTALYKKGMNLGVRLGTPSKIGDGYLAVIDMDVKSTDPKHRSEMEAAARKLFPSLNTAPTVESGRGNGSSHAYVLLEKPAETRRLAQSGEKVEVYMPSAAPSRTERETLSKKRLEEGYRLRPAWEITLMGEGSQVVLPPSIHPDSKKPYKWLRGWETPLYIETQKKEPKPGMGLSQALDLIPLETEINLRERGVPARIVEMIEDGAGVEDRSAALLGVAIALLKSGLTEAEVVTVLTDRSTYLGKTAFDHAQTTNRERAGKWIAKYTLPRAKQEADPGRDFMEEPPKKLSDEAAALQEEELAVDLASSWETELERGPINLGAKIKPTLKNLVLILENAVGSEVFKYNAFANMELYGMDTPWGGKAGKELKDSDTIDIKLWFAQTWKVEPHLALINEAATYLAHQNEFHPVRDYLDALEWDGVPRLDTWLKDYAQGDAPEPYLSDVSRKLLVALVARAYTPGCKYDQVVILQGNQGEGKSTLLRKLVGDKWFSDASLNVHDKDSILSMTSIWLRELGELSGMRQADVEQVKEFISRTTDRIRVPYGKRTEAFPRQCVFVGTTNNDEFLKDHSGNRRYWPLNVGKCDFEAIERDRDQLFAEAKFVFELGEPLYLENPESEKIAVKQQQGRMVSDTIVDHIEGFINENAKKPKTEQFNFEKFRLADAFKAGVFGNLKEDMGGQKRAGQGLRTLKFTKKESRDEKGAVRNFWFFPK